MEKASYPRPRTQTLYLFKILQKATMLELGTQGILIAGSHLVALQQCVETMKSWGWWTGRTSIKYDDLYIIPLASFKDVKITSCY